MNDEFWASLGVRRVINAAGKMTYLGSSVLSAEVRDAMAQASTSHVEMAALKQAVAGRIAEITGAPAAWVTASAASGIVQCVAGAITGTDPEAIETLHDGEPGRREVVLMAGHAVNFGAPITLMIGLGGAAAVKAGNPLETTTGELAEAIGPNTVAVLFVSSHHTTTVEGPDLTEVVELAHRRDVPVIVDAAAEEDLSRHLSLGADAVIFSGHKAISGPTSGLVLGKPELVAACAAQETGVGRAMKVSKETLAGLMVAVENYVGSNRNEAKVVLQEKLERLRAAIDGTLPVAVSLIREPGRSIARLRLHVGDDAPFSAAELIRRLEEHTPSVRTRNHQAAKGIVDLDLRETQQSDIAVLADILRAVLEEKGVA